MTEGQGGTVLIVEDDPGVARLQQRRLERAGYAVRHAATAADAQAEIDRGGIELVLLDYRLPDEENGLDFYARLKNAGQDVPVILVTGYGNDAIVIAALRAGVRDFVTKSPEYLDYLPEAARRVLEQVRTEALLAESRARLAAIIDSAMDAILTVDAGQRITLFNAAAEQVFQCSAANALGQPVDRFLRGGLPRGTDGGPAAPQAGDKRPPGSWRWEMRGLRRGPEEFPIEVSLSHVLRPGQEFHTLVVRDLTHQEQAERRIREQAALLDKATDAILVRDAQGRVSYWNLGCERLYGWPASDAVGKDADQLLFPEPTPELEAVHRTLEQKGEWTGELRHVTREGKEIVVASRWTVVRDWDGHSRAQLVISTDVTDKKRLEAQYLRAQRLESIGRLAGGIAHDLNNVLGHLLLALECLKEERMPPEDRLALVQDLQASARRGADIVKQVLSFARGAEGQRAVFQPRHILREVEKILRHTLPKGVEIATSLPEALWPVVGDTTQLYQVFMNLCVNAVDAMPRGGELTLTAENAVLDENYASMHLEAKPGRYVLLRVADTGVGIPPEVLDKVFDPFFTTKEPGKGTGLGLSTTLTIVKGHGGFVSVYSEVGKGTEFQVYLPAAESEYAQAGEPEPGELPTGQGELILVIDDEASFRQITRATLETFGYRVLTAADGAEAVALFANHPGEVRAVVTDLMMPIMDGAATIRALKKLNPQVRIMAVSGLAGNGKTAGAAALGVSAFLQKPYTADRLLRTLRTLLDAP